LVNLLVDIIYTYIDPRIKYDEERRRLMTTVESVKTKEKKREKYIVTTMKRLFKNKLAIAGLVIVIMQLILALTAP
ncbi:hypothetical protein R0K19_24810, partial [Bacillus sp. SIMBA_161]